MYRVIECLTQEHIYWLVGLAAAVCLTGSCLSVLMSRRTIQSSGARQTVQLGLTGLIGAVTIWSTHFLAMLAYDPGVEHTYDLPRTALSLGVALVGMLVSHWILTFGPRFPHFAISGAVFGATVATMHFVGMSAYILPGDMIWNRGAVVSAVVLGVLLGSLAHHRIAYPVTRYCWLGGAVVMVLAICTMHFTAMSAFEIDLLVRYDVPEQLIPEPVLGLVIVAVTAAIFLTGFGVLSIENTLETEASGRLRHAARHDPLTRLPNRMLLTQRMAEFQRTRAENAADHMAVLTIDLDGFGGINDLYGHPAGDTVLKTVATRLNGLLEPGEFLARTGGNEFVALKRGFDDVTDIHLFAERLFAQITVPIDIRHTHATMTASVGFATSLHDGDVPDELLHRSYLAMQGAKSSSTQNIAAFDAELDAENRDRLVMLKQLRETVKRGGFTLVYQLQNDLITLDPIGFEVLIRWQHPDRGHVSPAEFIPLAEETGLIREIGLWVLRTSCAEAASWSKPYSVAVNVAPQQLVEPAFLENVSDILMQTRLPPERLELEVTEASIIDDQERTLEVMHKLKAMGIKIAMDDFGTGYSSLATLQAFPFDKIKIDRSFIQDVHKDHQRAAIVRATLLLGAALSIPVLAEGVEEEEELRFLQAEKCNSVQGFYFGKPLSLEEVRKMLSVSERQKAS